MLFVSVNNDWECFCQKILKTGIFNYEKKYYDDYMVKYIISDKQDNRHYAEIVADRLASDICINESNWW